MQASMTAAAANGRARPQYRSDIPVGIASNAGYGAPERRAIGAYVMPEFSKAQMEQFENLVFTHRRLKEGQVLYRAGDPCEALYLVRAGFIKSLVMHEDGREQVSGVHMVGEMFGIDGIASGRHASEAVALTESDVCVIPNENLHNLTKDAYLVQRQLYRLFSQEVVRTQSMLLLLGGMRAEERVVTFLLDLSRRFTARGFSASDFILRMTREEICSLLGIRLETVSRIFSRFQKAGLIEIEGKHVRILRLDGLRAMLMHQPPHQAPPPRAAFAVAAFFGAATTVCFLDRNQADQRKFLSACFAAKCVDCNENTRKCPCIYRRPCKMPIRKIQYDGTSITAAAFEVVGTGKYACR